MFSKTTEYALRAVIYIAQKGTKDQKIGIDEIADAIDSPKSFIAKILQTLSKGSSTPLLHSATGPGGGYYMTKAALRKPAMAILKAMGERSTLEDCVLGLAQCSDKRPCPLHVRYKHIKPKLIAMFEEKTIQQLANELGKGRVLGNLD